MVREIALNRRTIGVNFKEDHAEVLVWSPFATAVYLLLHETGEKNPLTQQDYGYWFLRTSQLKPNDAYKFEMMTADGIISKPDPASLFQPNGIHEASVALKLDSYQFQNQQWKGMPLAQYLIYEIHVGTFSPAGNFASIIRQLPHLVELGITAIELMPVASFPGERNWGYDGVFPFAVQASYGGPQGLQQLVDACHQHGIAVILDVVYNHFGPEGNHLPAFGPYFTQKYQTPWGEALNFDDAYADGVRHFFIENLFMWFRDFHIDALRLDAVHAIKDFSAMHLLAEMRRCVDQFNEKSGRSHYLLIECDLNDRRYIADLSHGGYGMDAQWIDEFHHALRVAAGQEKKGYYADFNGVDHLAKAYKDAYVYDGTYSAERKKTFGNRAEGHLGEQFIVFSQNHDQIGNRILGERSSILYSFSMQKLLAAAVMVSPYIPLLFMGEEWGERAPFQYFVSHGDPELIQAVRKGRANEFKAFQHIEEVPDPQDEQTFLRSKLNWEDLQKVQHQTMLKYYQSLIALRKSNPVFSRLNREQLHAEALPKQNCLILHRWHQQDHVLCFLNFSNMVQEINFSDAYHWEKIFDSQASAFGGEKQSNFKQFNQEIFNIQPESIVIFARQHV